MANRPNVPLPKYGYFLNTRSMAEIQARATEWLWDGWLPLGNVCLMAGDGGTGKSTILCDLAARVSRGVDFPCGGKNLLGKPGHVLIFNPEDNVDNVLKPRLAAVNADMAYVHIGTAFRGNLIDEYGDCTYIPTTALDSFGKEGPNTALMLWLREKCENAALVIIDPVTSFLEGVDANSNAEVKKFVSSLQIIAKETNSCILLVTHLSKNMEAEAQGRVIGSCAWVHGPRNILLVTADKKAITERKENTELSHEPCIGILSNPKNNLGRRPLPIGFEVVDCIVADEDNNTDIHIGRTMWDARHQNPDFNAGRQERTEVKEWCMKVIQPGYPMDSMELYKLGADQGFSESRIRRALNELFDENLLIRENDGKHRKWSRTEG